MLLRRRHDDGVSSSAPSALSSDAGYRKTALPLGVTSATPDPYLKLKLIVLLHSETCIAMYTN